MQLHTNVTAVQHQQKGLQFNAILPKKLKIEF